MIAVALTHIGSDVVATQLGVSRGWCFYIARGLEGVFLFGLLLNVSPYVAAAALWGVIEEAMTSVCGAVTWLHPVQLNGMQGLCDAQLGFPLFHWVGLILACLLAMSIALRDLNNRGANV